eukprot:m.297617 g.297617  ORF g.297617 m.297617 type:complete len:51 (-) comp82376_c0_seq1:25-177(-)
MQSKQESVKTCNAIKARECQDKQCSHAEDTTATCAKLVTLVKSQRSEGNS